jgi:hypothetical protein
MCLKVSIAGVARTGELFHSGNAHPAYCNLRDSAENTKWRAFCERLWERYQPYADRHFLDEIRVQFHQRFWEMYLAVTFLERGCELHRHKDGGPEFGIDICDRRYWFDAIAPNPGEGPDAVPQFEFNRPIASKVPEEQIVLRLTSALAAKRAKWKKDLDGGLVSERDGFIVAMNDRAIRCPWLWGGMPYIVKALYGFGPLLMYFDRRTREVVDTKNLHRPRIAKASGSGISSQPFAAGECPEVSAILHSSVDAADLPGVLGADFMILHNREPNVPLHLGALRFSREYWADGDQLKIKDWSEAESASGER